MSNWYTTRSAVKRAGGPINGSTQNERIDRIIESQSRRIDTAMRRRFIPFTDTLLYRWPQLNGGRSYVLWLKEDLLSVTTLQAKAQDSSPTTIAASDFFVEPANQGPPFDRIEIDLSSSAAFESGDTPQRSISVLGSWGYSDDRRSSGTVGSGLSSSSTATSFVHVPVTGEALLDVGDTLLIESEQVFISGVANAAQVNNDLINGALIADLSEVAITLDTSSGSRYQPGEVILVDSERMFIESISGDVLTVVRAYDGSLVAVHSNDAPIDVFRTFTIERAANGTTAATHADTTAISKYEPEFEIQQLCLAEVLAQYHQESAGWGRSIGAGEGAREFNGKSLSEFRKQTKAMYQRARSAAI